MNIDDPHKKLALRRLSEGIESAEDLAEEQGNEDVVRSLRRTRKLLQRREVAMPKRRLSDWLNFVQYGRTDVDTTF